MSVLIDVIESKYGQLNTLIYDVIEKTEDDESESGTYLYSCLKSLHKNLHEAIPVAREVAAFADQYDFNEHTKGNGYRSYVQVFIQSLAFTIQECVAMREKRQVWWRFSKALHARNIDGWSRVFAALSTIYRILISTHAHSEKACLVPTANEALIQNLESTKKIDISAFYGPIGGFQFTPSVRPFMLFWCILLATFSEISSAGVVKNSYTPSIFSGMRYLFDDYARAKRVAALFSRGSVRFFQEFLSLANNRLVTNFCSLTQPSLAVNIQFSLPPVTLELRKQDGAVLKITPPSAHLGYRSLDCRLLCSRLRQGMAGNDRYKQRFSMSHGLVIYIHGGGFVATTSKNFEMYLKNWAVKLDAPIFCVDYILAPEAQYPRQLEECFYAYCWALRNANLLGTSADKICLCGDSAGGSLAMGVVLKCMEHGVRLPSGLFLAYTPIILNMSLCPSRLFSLLDPIIPFGFLFKCFQAYLGESAGKLPEVLENLVYVDEEEAECMMTLPETDPSKNPFKNGLSKEDNTSTTTLTDTARRAAQSVISYFTSLLPSNGSHRYSLLTAESGDVVDRHMENIYNATVAMKMRQECKTMTVTTILPGSTVVKEFHDCRISPDIYLSPYYAPEEMLRQLPKISLMTTDLDPFLDDNVVFAKKLKDIGVDVDLEILEGLPHAFLITVLASKDARRGSDKAITLIRRILETEKR